MGLFSRMHERTAQKMDESRTKAYQKAKDQGASEEQANAAGEKAARRRRRTRRSMPM